jgi:hypothetical protein
MSVVQILNQLGSIIYATSSQADSPECWKEAHKVDSEFLHVSATTARSEPYKMLSIWINYGKFSFACHNYYSVKVEEANLYLEGNIHQFETGASAILHVTIFLFLL